MKLSLICLASVLATLNLYSQESISKIDLSIFPKPAKGYKMMVIEVPHSSNTDKKISFYASKFMDTDTCNNYILSGTFEMKDLQGWGYHYYEFKTNGNVISTQMGCGENKTIGRLVNSQAETITYNGKMPTIIYIPENLTVQFKIYSADDEIYTAAEQFKQKG